MFLNILFSFDLSNLSSFISAILLWLFSSLSFLSYSYNIIEYLKNLETDISSSFEIFLPLHGVLTRVNDGSNYRDLAFILNVDTLIDTNGAVTDTNVTDPIEADSVVVIVDRIGI